MTTGGLFVHKGQREVLDDRHRFRIVAAGRRWGKCLAPGTRISMADGSVKPVEDIRPGDFVLTVNEDTYAIEPKPVQHVHDNGVKETLIVRTASRSIQLTPNHPLLVDNCWTEARDIKPGSFVAVLGAGVEYEPITKVEYAGEAQTYDLTIQDNHNFFANGIATHNTRASLIALVKAIRKPNSFVWYVAPSYRMARTLMWYELLNVIPPEWIVRKHETRMEFELINGTRLELKGADRPDMLRGVGLDFLVIDEAQDVREETWSKVLRPTLASTGGRALIIGTPKGTASWFYEVYERGQRGKFIVTSKGKRARNAFKSWQFPTITSPFIPREEIEAARADLDEKSFEQEFNADFINSAGRVYYTFDRKSHIADVSFDASLPIWVGMDFNVDPMSAIILQPRRDGVMVVVDEIVMGPSSTEETAEELARRYYRYQKNVTIYPDPAGGYRSSARGETDLEILRDAGFKKIKYRRKHPPVADRVNAVNRMFKSASGLNRMFVSNRCSRLIQSLEQTIYKPNSRDIDKTLGNEHATDALGYCIEYEFPLRDFSPIGVSI